MKKEVTKAIGWASLFTAALVVLIVVGSRNLSHFDAALVAYTFASLAGKHHGFHCRRC